MLHGKLFVRLGKCVRKRLTERQGREESVVPGGGFAAAIPGHQLCKELGTPSGVAATGPYSWAVPGLGS